MIFKKKNLLFLCITTNFLWATETSFLEVEGLYSPQIERMYERTKANSSEKADDALVQTEFARGYRVGLGMELYQVDTYNIEGSIGIGQPFMSDSLLSSDFNYLGLDFLIPLNDKWSLDIGSKVYRYTMYNNYLGEETDFGVQGTASLGIKMLYKMNGYFLTAGYEYIKNPNFEHKETGNFMLIEENSNTGEETILENGEITRTQSLDIGGGYFHFGLKVPF